VKIKDTSIQSQIRFWSAIGPLISLLTLFVCSLKYSYLYFGIAGAVFIGIPLSWYFRWKGTAVAAAVLLGFLLPRLLTPGPDTFWSLGISLASFFSLLIIGFSFEEVSKLIDSVEIESGSRLDNLLKLDEKINESSRSYADESERFRMQIKECEEEIEKYKERASASDRLARIVREELAGIYAKHEETLQELFDWQTKYSAAQKKLEQPLPPTTSDEELKRKAESADTFESLLEFSEEEKKISYIALENCRAELREIKQAHENLCTLYQEKECELNMEKQKSESITISGSEKELVYQKLFEESRTESERLEKEKNEMELALQKALSEKEAADKKAAKKADPAKKIPGEVREIQGKYNQLKAQFDEKSQMLDDTRRAIFRMQEKLVNTQREYEELKKAEKLEIEASLQEQIRKMDEERSKTEEEYKLEITSLHDIIATLSAKEPVMAGSGS